MNGPYETEEEAVRDPAVQQIYEAASLAAASHQMLCEALDAAGTEPGAYDHRIIRWLASFEPQACAVVAGLISRAHQAGRSAAAGDTRRLTAIRGILAAHDWEHGSDRRALERIEDIITGGQP